MHPSRCANSLIESVRMNTLINRVTLSTASGSDTCSTARAAGWKLPVFTADAAKLDQVCQLSRLYLTASLRAE